MKTIIYVLIAVFAFGIIAHSFKSQSRIKNSILIQSGIKNSILIQSTDKMISSETLSQSAKIISDRLNSYSPGKFEFKVIPEMQQIQIISTDHSDFKTVKSLLTQKGVFGFYATYNQTQLSDLLKGDNHLFSLLNVKNSNNSSAEIGYATLAGVEKVNEYLRSLALNQSCKFVWSQPADDGEVCLYALRLDSTKGAILTGADIDNFKCVQGKNSGNYIIGIEFKKPAVAIWADATRRNINNAIAIVLDDQVLMAPVIRSVIEGGKCEISGKFTQTEARCMTALGNNGELPVSFKIVR